LPTLGRPTIATVGMPVAASADGEFNVGWGIRSYGKGKSAQTVWAWLGDLSPRKRLL
jgi:hypothetical protein